MCGADIEAGAVGRPRMYCSPACKQRAYRARASPAAADPRELEQRATALAGALAEEAFSCMQALQSRPKPRPAGASAHDLAKTALGYAWELLQATRVLEPPPPTCSGTRRRRGSRRV
jgi:hypothetical protein